MTDGKHPDLKLAPPLSVRRLELTRESREALAKTEKVDASVVTSPAELDIRELRKGWEFLFRAKQLTSSGRLAVLTSQVGTLAEHVTTMELSTTDVGGEREKARRAARKACLEVAALAENLHDALFWEA